MNQVQNIDKRIIFVAECTTHSKMLSLSTYGWRAAAAESTC